MKIISWNVNGLRANVKKGSFDWLLNSGADIFCLQETKVHPEQLDEAIRKPDGFESYFDHSKLRKGYSGVAIYTNRKPEKVEYGLGIEEFDKEGRMISLFFNDFVLINCYFPNGGGGPDRLEYKLKFYDEFLKYIENITKKGLPLIFCGDVNTAHTEADLSRPKENEKNTGFLPIERAWIDKIISHGYTDVWRNFNPDLKNKFTWWDMKTFSRDRNIGWRLDYFFADIKIIPKIKSTGMLEKYYGSDHCPIYLEMY